MAYKASVSLDMQEQVGVDGGRMRRRCFMRRVHVHLLRMAFNEGRAPQKRAQVHVGDLEGWKNRRVEECSVSV